MSARTMAKARPKPCPACITPRPADSVQEFSIGDSKYRLEGCDKHLDQFLTVLLTWVRMAVPVETSDASGLKPSAKAVVKPDRGGTLAYRIHPEIPDAVVQLEEDEVAVPAPPAPRFTPSPIHPERWTFTDHAIGRMTERNMTVDDAVWAAEHPDITRPSKRHPNCIVSRRGPFEVVFDPAVREVLTVWNRQMDDHTTVEQELELRNAS